MASVDTIVTISITIQDASVSQAGFGTPLVMTHEAAFTPELVRIYGNTTDMVADGFAAAGATVLAVNAIFAQQPKVAQVKVGIRTSTPTTMTRIMTVAVNVVGATYTVTINGTAFTATGAATAILTATALVTAINLGVEPVTATDNLDGTFDLTEDVDGDLFGLTHTVTNITQDDTTADAGVAADYAAIKIDDSDFYGVLMTSSATLEIEALSTAVEADAKIFGANSSDDDILSNTAGNLFETLAAASLNRTFPIFSRDNFDFAACAWMGERFPDLPGVATWAFKTLATVTVDALTGTQINNIETNDGNHYTPTGGVNITLQGTMASGRFIDITRGIDWLSARMQERLFGQLVDNKKIPFTNQGVNKLDNQVKAQLTEAVNQSVLAGDPAPTTTAPNVLDPAQVSAANRAARTLPPILFDGQLAGAIHKLSVTGTVSA